MKKLQGIQQKAFKNTSWIEGLKKSCGNDANTRGNSHNSSTGNTAVAQDD